ncbi:hypothetical protein CBER1_11834 [Cercospora berteroae]|uniref:Uncharacterized protein n=1 Tax=Cercospora berteroae TaxID=357750 RepID=A0A2S6C0L0_9PEZI|nr:hypothetical protein CBER1_11834 [Cercospora berteroae]
MDDMPHIPSAALDDLADIFVKHKVQGIFGVGLIHSHCTLKEGDVMLSTQLQAPARGCWNKATEIASIDPSRVRGHMFKLAGVDKLVAYKVEQGQVTDLRIESAAFFQEFAEYLSTAGLAGLLGLQVLSGTPTYGVEFDFGDVGTVVLNEADTKHGPVSHTTGWMFSVDEGGTVSCKGNTVHAPTTKGPHKVFVDSKLVQNYNDLDKALRHYAVW